MPSAKNKVADKFNQMMSMNMRMMTRMIRNTWDSQLKDENSPKPVHVRQEQTSSPAMQEVYLDEQKGQHCLYLHPLQQVEDEMHLARAARYTHNTHWPYPYTHTASCPITCSKTTRKGKTGENSKVTDINTPQPAPIPEEPAVDIKMLDDPPAGTSTGLPDTAPDAAPLASADDFPLDDWIEPMDDSTLLPAPFVDTPDLLPPLPLPSPFNPTSIPAL
ncbi:hypothetical protein BDR04DRAFT_1116068 [Suillus decipiens]|nr:hypothetical protein BDR04DRAFT_1116068 [Suillus decipiens]